jgi:transposase InsO family protein
VSPPKGEAPANGTRNSTASAPIPNNSTTKRAKLGYGYLHTAIDDHSRLAYTEILTDETKETATAFMARALDHFTDQGIAVERVLTDNGSCYRSHLWRDLLHDNNIKHKRTRPYRPQTNGKVERFHRTLADEWPTPAPTDQNASDAKRFPRSCAGITITAATPTKLRPGGSQGY